MGTRSLTYVYDEDNHPVVCMYRQFDGYPTGHGAELAAFLKSGTMVNGLSGGKDLQFNGMNCLAASMVASFKTGGGSFYLHAPILGRDDWQEYEYHVFADKVVVYEGYYDAVAPTILFSGSWSEFEKFCGTESFVLSDDTVERLKTDLHKGVVEVTFVKNDGSTRVMKCTLSENIIPISTETTKAVVKKKQHNPDVLPVWDIEADGWRSFRWDSISSARVV